MPLSEVRSTAPTLSALIERMIERCGEERHPLRLPEELHFPDELEAVHEAETSDRRVRELRFTMAAAAGFQLVIAITDPLFVPDLGWEGIALRVFVAAYMVFGLVFLDRLSARVRELAVCGAAFSFILVLMALPLLSHAELAPYEMFASILGMIYANTTAPLRFRYAWRFTLLCVASLFASLFWNPRIGLGLACALFLLGCVGGAFSLIANYRMERSARLGYLLAAKESLRLSALARDRDYLVTESSTDALTGLVNRRQFDRRFAAFFNAPEDSETPVCLLMLDVDFFKRYNDHYGHPVGDTCLREIAAVMRRVIRGKRDFAFRYGGEEFGLMLHDVTMSQARQVGERLRTSVEAAAIRHENRDDGIGYVTVSVGMAYLFAGRASTRHELLRRADSALYEAKRGGRNRVEFAA